MDETVKVTKKFLEDHLDEAGKVGRVKTIPSGEGIIGAEIISRFLGWTTSRIQFSLERLRMIEEGRLDKETVEKMPTAGRPRKRGRVLIDWSEIERRTHKRAEEKKRKK